MPDKSMFDGVNGSGPVADEPPSASLPTPLSAEPASVVAVDESLLPHATAATAATTAQVREVTNFIRSVNA
jgi:hypothetical protein